MKLLSKIATACAALAVAGAANAAIITPQTGDSELLLVLADPLGSGANFTFDTGILLSQFNKAINYSFDLTAPLAAGTGTAVDGTSMYNNFKAAVGTGIASFTVLASDSTGNGIATAGARNTLFTTTQGVAPFIPTNTAFVGISAGVGPNWYQALNSVTGPTIDNQSTHFTQTNGASFTTLTTGPTSYSVFANNWVNPYKLNMVNVGQNAEMWSGTNTVGAGGKVTTTDLGGYWTVTPAGQLNYFAAPVPEASEWAMLLAGLGVIGAMVRRRSFSV